MHAAQDTENGERVARGSREGETSGKQVVLVVQVRKQVGKPLLFKGMAKGSDPGVALPQVTPSK
jgi:hypothetical protein